MRGCERVGAVVRMEDPIEEFVTLERAYTAYVEGNLALDQPGVQEVQPQIYRSRPNYITERAWARASRPLNCELSAYFDDLQQYTQCCWF